MVSYFNWNFNGNYRNHYFILFSKHIYLSTIVSNTVSEIEQYFGKPEIYHTNAFNLKICNFYTFYSFFFSSDDIFTGRQVLNYSLIQNLRGSILVACILEEVSYLVDSNYWLWSQLLF